ncbi:MAG: bacteriophage Gp15 family protein [Clostridia bacterium]|nr:bacteriophage Gp15 family protein [Clostridia bacterium]
MTPIRHSELVEESYKKGKNMNLLTSTLPAHIEIEGEKYPVNTDFRIWIKFEEVLKNTQISELERLISACELCFDFKKKKRFPKNAAKTLKALMEFYSCGALPQKNTKKSVPTCSFSEDGGYIYGAFLAQYGIDLTEAELHWWKFCALFSSLQSEQKICEIMRIRGIDLSRIKDSERRRELRKLKNIYKLLKTNEIDIAGEFEKAF